MKYVINPIRIECGDILIEKHSDNTEIVAATGCDYTHAVLCDTFPTAYEAEGTGVTEISLLTRIYESEDDVILLRPREALDTSQLIVLTSYPKQLFGTDYGAFEARRMQDRRPDKAITPNRQMCTRLVCQAYDRIGIKLVENVDYPFVTDILNSEQLIRIEDFLREAIEDDLQIFPNGHPSQKDFPEFMDKILTCARNIYKGKDIQNIEQLVKVVYEYAQKGEYIEKDAEMEAYMREEGFFFSLADVFGFDPHMYDFDEFIRYTEVHFGDKGAEKLMIDRLVLAQANVDWLARELEMCKIDAHYLGLYCKEIQSPLLKSLRDHALNRIEINERRLDVKSRTLKLYGID